MFKIDKNVRRLSDSEKKQYEKDGYITGLPVFSRESKTNLDNLFTSLTSKLDKKIDINQTNYWHKASAKFYNLCRTPAILDYVEDIIGPNFYQWGGQFFVKEPNDESVVPWHQDAQYWPLSPSKTVTVWLAMYDTDEANGAMRIVKGSHKQGIFKHRVNSSKHFVLDQEVPEDKFNTSDIVSLNLKAGEVSLHDDGLLHGSLANNSDRRRCGITMRFAPVHVKADLKVWPHFETQLARGIDNLNLNPIAKIPEGEATPVKKFQYSREFVKDW